MTELRFVLMIALIAAVVAEPVNYRSSADIITAHGSSGAEGAGTAVENHAVQIHAEGVPSSNGNGWGWGSSPALVHFEDHGDAELGNNAAGEQVSSLTSTDVSAAQQHNANNVGSAGNSMDIVALGGELSLGSSSNSNVVGSGNIGVIGNLDLHYDGAPNIGYGRP